MIEKLTEVVNKDEKIVTSARNELIWQDVKRSLYNSVRFAWPLIALALVSLQMGKSFEDISLLLYGSGIQLALDLGYKYFGTDKYIVPKE